MCLDKPWKQHWGSIWEGITARKSEILPPWLTLLRSSPVGWSSQRGESVGDGGAVSTHSRPNTRGTARPLLGYGDEGPSLHGGWEGFPNLVPGRWMSRSPRPHHRTALAWGASGCRALRERRRGCCPLVPQHRPPAPFFYRLSFWEGHRVPESELCGLEDV